MKLKYIFNIKITGFSILKIYDTNNLRKKKLELFCEEIWKYVADV